MTAPRRGRPPRRNATPVRITPLVPEEVLAIVDRHRGTLTRAGALRISLLLLVQRMEEDGEVEVGGRTTSGRRQFALELPDDLYARAQALVSSGRASSLADLVRAAGMELGKGDLRG